MSSWKQVGPHHHHHQQPPPPPTTTTTTACSTCQGGSCTKVAAHPEGASGHQELSTPAAHAPCHSMSLPSARGLLPVPSWLLDGDSVSPGSPGVRAEDRGWERRGGGQGSQEAQFPNPGLVLILMMILVGFLVCFFFLSFFFLGPHLRHIEVPRLGVESEL